MNEPQPGKFRSLPCLVQLMIFAVFAIVLAVGCLLLFMYFIGGGYEYDRARGVAERVLGEIKQLDAEVRYDALPGATMLHHVEPHASIGHLALSDGSPQYASVVAEQDFRTLSDSDAILQHYDQLFTDWGWLSLPLTANAGNVAFVYQHPTNELLLAGLCQPKFDDSSKMMQFRAFLDFHEASGDNGCPDRLCYVDSWHCRHFG